MMQIVDDADIFPMQRALVLAQRAAREGEVPVGAVVVLNGQIVGQGFNRPIRSHDSTAHAEVVALRAAGAQLGTYRLIGATLYVTIEPCAMCAGALVHARVERLVFGAREPRAGAVVSTLRLLEQPHLNHRVAVTEGVLADASATLLRQFFAERR